MSCCPPDGSSEDFSIRDAMAAPGGCSRICGLGSGRADASAAASSGAGREDGPGSGADRPPVQYVTRAGRHAAVPESELSPVQGSAWVVPEFGTSGMIGVNLSRSIPSPIQYFLQCSMTAGAHLDRGLIVSNVGHS
jgi:hypothetical protein